MNAKALSICAALAALAVALPERPVQAQTAEITCPTPSVEDRDGDGFSDMQECLGVLLLDGTTFPGVLSADGAPTNLPRAQRLDPNSKDLFVIYRRASATLLGGLPDPFARVTFNNVAFNGLADLGVTAHVLYDDAGLFQDRTVSIASPQKAVRVSESLDAGGTVLGNCQWGTPFGLDGCIVYTQRAKNFIDATCPGDSVDVRNQVFHAYATFLILHEAGHSLGGLAAAYNSRFGGYHYKAGANVIMEQAATYSAKQNRCTWYISSRWNTSLDQPAVRLK
jgi:hypothetical protein